MKKVEDYMNILFLTQYNFTTKHKNSIYEDLVKQLESLGHHIYVISPLEKREKKDTYIIKENNTTIMRVRTGNAQKNNAIEKAITILTIEKLFTKAIKEHFGNVHFTMVLYATPPVTFYQAVRYVKKRDGAFSYLMLKDIFPQNAIDIGIIGGNVIGKIIAKFFRSKEKKLYQISDYIGCMSPANVQYLLKHNKQLDEKKVGLCPNSISIIDRSITKDKKKSIRKEYGIPEEKTVIIYGGNLGKPQGIDFLIECLQVLSDNDEIFFVIVGDGTEYNKLADNIDKEKLQNVILLRYLPQEEYNRIVSASDIGAIYLDYRFTIPNFPSRILGYMQARLPILACTDYSTDMGRIIQDEHFGWFCPSDSIQLFKKTIKEITELNQDDFEDMGNTAFDYLNGHFNVIDTTKSILQEYYQNVGNE